MTETTMPETVETPVPNENVEAETNALAEQVDEGLNAPESEPQETQEDTEPEWFVKRIGKITAQKHEALSAAEQAKQEAARAREDLAAMQARLQALENPKPNINGFDDVAEYEKAMDAYYQARTPKAPEPTPQPQLSDETARKAQEIIGEGRASKPDFDEVFQRAPIPLHIAEVLVDVPKAADVAYYLGQNPHVGHELAQMTPTAAAIRLGQISSGLETAAPKPKSTNAPPPPKPTTGGGEAAPTPDSKLSLKELQAKRNRERAAKMHK